MKQISNEENFGSQIAETKNLLFIAFAAELSVLILHSSLADRYTRNFYSKEILNVAVLMRYVYVQTGQKPKGENLE